MPTLSQCSVNVGTTCDTDIALTHLLCPQRMTNTISRMWCSRYRFHGNKLLHLLTLGLSGILPNSVLKHIMSNFHLLYSYFVIYKLEPLVKYTELSKGLEIFKAYSHGCVGIVNEMMKLMTYSFLINNIKHSSYYVLLTAIIMIK